MAAAHRVAWVALAVSFTVIESGCLDSPALDEPTVFRDNYVDDGFQPFSATSGADPNAVTVDPTVTRVRTEDSPTTTANATLKISVPAYGQYAGGAIVASVPRDLSGYNAVTFWAIADLPGANLAAVGVGNDNTGNSVYPATTANMPIGQTWAKYVMPLPLPAAHSYEAGLFEFSAAAIGGAGYHLWLDDVKYEKLDSTVVGTPIPRITNSSNATFTLAVGQCPVSINSTETSISGLNGSCPNFSFTDLVQVPVTVPAPATLELTIPPAYLTFHSANEAIALVDIYGLVTAAGCPPDMSGNPVYSCSTTVTASLGATPSPDSATVNVTVPPIPTTAPTPPALPASSVISLLSRAYPNVVNLAGGGLTDSWGTDWSNGGYPAGGPHLTQLQIDGDNVLEYSSLAYVGIDFESANPTLCPNCPIDGTAMNYLHMDIWTATATALSVQLEDFNPAGTRAAAVALPAPAHKTWVPIDIPLATFASHGPDVTCDPNGNFASSGCLDTKAHLGQIVLVSDGTATLYVDNLYFHE